ncbi:MAG: cytidine deaminase [Christensenellales bacterium]
MEDIFNYDNLIESAKSAAENAYVPYSEYPIGAAVLSISGKVYLGCNIENASFGATICAERVAVFNAISAGEREFVAIAVYHETELAYPCGICLQVLSEFNREADVIIASDMGARFYKLSELLPHAFSGDDIKN